MDTDALIKLWKGPANATALVDWSPPAFLKGYLPLKEGQPIRVVEPFGNWWWSMCEAGNFGYVKHSLLAPHWVEPQPWFVNLWLPGDLNLPAPVLMHRRASKGSFLPWRMSMQFTKLLRQ